MKIFLNAIDDVKKFTNVIANHNGESTLVSGRYCVDAKSIMGIFSLDLSKPITLNLYGEVSDNLMTELAKFSI